MRKGTRNGMIVGGLGLAIGLVGIWLWLRCRHHHKSHHQDSDTDQSERWEHDCPQTTNCGPVRAVIGYDDPDYCTIRKGCEGITKKVY